VESAAASLPQATLLSMKKEPSMLRVSVEYQPQRWLAGFSFFGDPFHAHAGWTEANEIGRLWQRLLRFQQLPAAQELRLAQPGVAYEVHLQQPDTAHTGEFEVFVGVEVPTLALLPVELCLKLIPAATFAVFTLRGDEIKQDEPLIDSWLQANGYVMASSLLMQRYDERFKGLDRLDESELQWLVPVRALEAQRHEPA
jgi:predicted transcriptional regulator YdeE